MKTIVIALSALLAVSSLCHSAAAAARPEDWRAEVIRTRTLAENDAPRAYEAAEALQDNLPTDASAADKASVLNLLARIEIYLAQTDRSARHARLAFEIAQQAGDKIGQAEADLNMALNSVNQGNIDELVTATTRSLAELEGANRPDLLGEALLRTAMMYRRVGQIDDSVAMAIHAMEIARRIKDPWALTYAYQGLAISYDQSFRYKEALDYYIQMREQARVAKSKQLEAYAMLGIGGLTAAQGEARGAEKLIRQAVAQFRDTGAPFALNFALAQLANNLNVQRRYAESLAILDEVVATYERYPNRIGLWYSLNSRSTDHQFLKDMTAAQADARRAYALARDIGFPLYVSESAQRMATLAAAAKDYREAYDFAAEARDMSERAAREKVSARMIELARRSESEGRQREINELTERNRQQREELERQAQRQQRLWSLLGGTAVALAGLGFLMLRLRRSRSELRQKTSILQSVLDSMGDGVAVSDEHGQLILVNPMAETLGFGLSRGDFHDWTERYSLYLPDRVTPYPAEDLPLVRAIRGESCDKVEMFVRHPGLPQGRWLSVTTRPLTDPRGPARGGVAVFSDVTARKDAEAELRLREQEFRALVEHSPDMVARYDRACRRIYANPALRRALGLSTREAPDSASADLIDISADLTRRYREHVRAVFASGEGATVALSLPSVSIQVRLVAERDVHGDVVSVLAIGRDVTEMMNTQRQLTTLLDNLPDMVARFDREGRCLYVNPAVTRAFEMPAERFLGRTLRELPLDSRDALDGALRGAVDAGAASILELPGPATGGERFFEVRHVPEMDEHGRVDSVLVIVRDVSERKRAEQVVRELSFRREAAREEERRYIARELHDELGQILSALRLEVSVLRMRFGQDVPGLIEKAAGMLALVDSVIRVQRDLVSSLRPAVLDLGISAALEWLVGDFSERNGIECDLQLSESQLDLDADQTTMVFRIVQESLTNVSRHSQARRVEVVLERRLEGYSLTVRDDGKGFDPAAARSPKSLGLIGLHERAQMLGGRLDVKSGAKTGVRINVTFPRALRRERA